MEEEDARCRRPHSASTVSYSSAELQPVHRSGPTYVQHRVQPLEVCLTEHCPRPLYDSKSRLLLVYLSWLADDGLVNASLSEKDRHRSYWRNQTVWCYRMRSMCCLIWRCMYNISSLWRWTRLWNVFPDVVRLGANWV